MRSRREEALKRVATGKGFIKQTRALLVAMGVVALGAGLLPRAVGAQSAPPDEHWSTLQTEHFRVTFPPGLEPLARRAGARAERAWSELADNFVDPPSGRIDILLTDHQDISNGFAQIHPSNRITVYARPPVDDMGLGYFDDWMELVITHELAHIFHLDRAGPIGRTLRSVFGRVPAPWPFFPSVGVPRWTTEGLATWYESYFSHAGRVHGTYHDMMVRTAEVEGAFPGLGQASGDSPIWPGGTLAYAFGSLFFEHLLDKYGPEKMGVFAEAVAGQWVPYRLNAASKDAFGHSLNDEWSAWEASVAEEVDSLRAARGARPSPPEPQRLTESGRVEWYPRPSPDGRTLAWARADGRSEVQIRFGDAQGRDSHQAMRTNAVATYDWDTDGSLVVSQLEMKGPYRAYDDLYVRAPDGDVRRLTHGARLTQPSVAKGQGWAVAVLDTLGTTALVRVDLADGTRTTLVPPDKDTHYAYPALSPDNRWLAVSRWLPGARLDVVILDVRDGHLVTQVTDDRAVDLAPAWSPDGAWLLWGSDRTGVANILAARVDPAAGTASAPRMVTDLLTGAAYPAVDPSGRWIYFSGYHAAGWDVERTAWAPDQWPEAPATIHRFDAPPRPVALQDAESPGVVKPYSPLPTLLPTYWTPLLRAPARTSTMRAHGLVIPGRDIIGTSVGVRSGGRDLVLRHAWEAFARVSTSTNAGLVDWGGAYDFAGFGNPVLSVAASQYWDDDGVRLGQRAKDAPLDTLFVLQRDRAVAAGITLRSERWRRSLAMVLSGGMTWEHQELLDNFLEPSTVYHLTLPETRFADTRATLVYSSSRTFGYQMGAAAGTSVLLRLRNKSQLNVADTLSTSVREALGQVRTFIPIGGPGFASHVLAFRASGGVASGRGADAGHFELGGESGSPETVTGLALFGGSSLFFPVRGYPEATRYGRYAWSVTGEYRVPLAVLNRGLGAWPLDVDRVMGSLFFDAGNAWGPDVDINGFENPRRATLASAGAEITTGVLAFWAVPMDLRFGAAVPLVERNGATFYLRLGLSF